MSRLHGSATPRHNCGASTASTSSGQYAPSYGSLSAARELPKASALDDFSTYRLQMEQYRGKLAEVAMEVQEVRRMLMDWSEVTKTGLADLRTELGALKLEQRFTQTLRSTSSREGSPRDTPTRCSVTPRETSSPDNLQASGSTSRDLGANTARLDAVEAACQDLRHNIQEVTSVPEATERLLKAELSQMVGQLRQELEAERAKATKSSVNLIRVEAASVELARRLEITERRFEAFEQDHLTETIAIKGRLEVAVRECDQHIFRADECQTQMKAEILDEVGRLRDGLVAESAKAEHSRMSTEAAGLELTRRLEESNRRLEQLEHVQQGQGAKSLAMASRLEAALRASDKQFCEASTVLTRVEALEEVQRAPGLHSRFQQLEDSLNCIQNTARGPEGSSNLKAELQQEIDKLTVELRCTKDELTAVCLSRVEVASAELWRKLEDKARELDEVRRVTLTGTQKRLQDVVGEQNSQLAAVGELRSLLGEEAAALRARMDAVECQLAAAGGAALSEDAEGAVHGVRAALATTNADVMKLAGDLATAREEHKAAISGIGSLTELVARSSATGIERSEERLAEVLASKLEELDRTASAKCEVIDQMAQAAVADALAQKAGSCRSPRLVMRGVDGRVQIEEPKSLDVAVAVAIAEMRTEAKATVAASEARLDETKASVTADLKNLREMLSVYAGQLEAAQVALRDFRPRVSALEAAVHRCRNALPHQAVQPAGQVLGSPLLKDSRACLMQAYPSAQPLEASQLVWHPSDATAGARATSPSHADVAEAHARGRSPSPPPRGRALAEVPAERGRSPEAEQPPAPATCMKSARHLQAGLEEKLEGIVCSVHQVIAGLKLGETPSTSGPAPQASTLQARSTDAGPSSSEPTTWRGGGQCDLSPAMTGHRALQHQALRDALQQPQQGREPMGGQHQAPPQESPLQSPRWMELRNTWHPAVPSQRAAAAPSRMSVGVPQSAEGEREQAAAGLRLLSPVGEPRQSLQRPEHSSQPALRQLDLQGINLGIRSHDVSARLPGSVRQQEHIPRPPDSPWKPPDRGQLANGPASRPSTARHGTAAFPARVLPGTTPTHAGPCRRPVPGREVTF